QATAIVVKQQKRLAVVDGIGINLLNEIVGMAVGNHEIKIAVVVVVEELEPPAAHEFAGGGNSGFTSDVVERLIMFVAVERVELMIEVGDEHVHEAILVEISGVDSHAGPSLAAFAERDTGCESDLLEVLPLLILEQEIGLGIVGDEQVHPAIIIYVGGDHRPTFAGIVGYAKSLTHVSECSVAVVMKKAAGCRRINARIAVLRLPRQCRNVRRTAAMVLRFAEIHEAADEKIELSVVVVIEPYRAGGPAWRCDASFVRYIREGAVAIVVIQNAAAILRHVKIGETIGVVVSNSDSHSVAAAGNTGFVGDVGECAVAIVVIECVPKRLGG